MMMYSSALWLHSWLRWAVLLAGLYFYGAVFTFEPAGPLTPIQIDNLS